MLYGQERIINRSKFDISVDTSEVKDTKGEEPLVTHIFF